MDLQNKRFCSRECESVYNRKDRPSREWLEQKYLIEKMTCPQIAKLLNKDAKTIYTWLKDESIPVRPRGTDIAESQRGKKKNYPNYWKGKKLRPEMKEKIRQAALKDGRVPYLNKDGIHWLKGKKGAISPVWKGGITPERQAFYGTQEWKQIANLVWRRDYGKCRRCGLSKYNENKITLDVHHIISFAFREGRAQLCNLVLLCEPCHYWVHSRENTNKEFIIDYEPNN